jgi:electron transport complex protein RnfC
MERIKLYGGLDFQIELPPPELPIEDVPPPNNVIIPLADKEGLSWKPLVQKDQMVLKGEKIAEDPNHSMIVIHSPLSGKVTDIKDFQFPERANILSIFIESDGQEQWKTDLIPSEKYLEKAPEALMGSVRDAGVSIIPLKDLPVSVGSDAGILPVKQMVINGIGHGFAEAIVRQLLVERSSDLLEGIELIKRVFQPEKIYLAMDEKHGDAIQATVDSGLEKTLELVKLDVYYPLGHPHLLFKEIFNKEIPSPGGKALDMGVAFASVDAILHALDAVKQGKPQLDTYMTVSGEGIHTAKNLKVRIGTPLGDVIEFCGGFNETPGRVVLGNPLDGSAQFSLDRPVLKDTRWLWVQPEKSVVADKYRSCISCGDCVDICPVKVMPNFLGKFCEFGKYEEAASDYDLFTCIECGLCAYVCPSRRPMVHFIRFGKHELALKEEENANE